MKFAVISDTHFISDRFFGDAPSKEALMSFFCPQTALRMASETDGVNTIIITGDLTDIGDRTSHMDLVKILRGYKEKGIRVCVLTATHDFHLGKAYARKSGSSDIYKYSPWESSYFDPETFDYRDILKDEHKDLPDSEIVPELDDIPSTSELWNLYREFGRDDAFSVCDEGHSYCVELNDNTWCLMLNDDYRDPDQSGVSSNYTLSCWKWIHSLCKEAKKQGKFIFACTHHPLLPPVPAYRIGATDKDMRSSFIGHRLADMGISLVFSGHTHFSDIGFMRSDRGNLLCDITTPSVRFYPPQFRIIDLDGINKRIKTISVPIEKVDGLDLGDKTLKEYIRQGFVDNYKRKAEGIKLPFGIKITEIPVKRIYPFCKHASELTKVEYSSIKDRRLFDILMEVALNMQGGDGEYTPETPEYKFLMGLCAVLDSICITQPFVNLKKKLKGYSLSEIIEPMLFNNYIPDSNAEFDFTKEPEKQIETHKFKSNAGIILMVVLYVLAIPLSVLSPFVSVLALPILTVKKSKKKDDCKPERY